ncbi:hypothetical protein EGW08_004191 [Elysia chlorotica]|uniref:Secreted protein n=1 Tax=Elysia chlorotica TaxID=188477 RepID=A0A3S1A156_ELYCH|nr:hypothetical protein EGW08_004191 [Elysia chlorotica]
MVLLRAIYLAMFSRVALSRRVFPTRVISSSVVFRFRSSSRVRPPAWVTPTPLRSRAVTLVLLWRPVAMALTPGSPSRLWSKVKVSRVVFLARASPMAVHPVSLMAWLEERVRVSTSMGDRSSLE